MLSLSALVPFYSWVCELESMQLFRSWSKGADTVSSFAVSSVTCGRTLSGHRFRDAPLFVAHLNCLGSENKSPRTTLKRNMSLVLGARIRSRDKGG